MIGTTISHYRILEKLGGGGMGVVYKAEDTKLKRTVALKFLPRELTDDAIAKKRFIQEAQSASSLDHPNICTIYEIDETKDGQLFIAMACYDGETLKHKIEKSPLEVKEAMTIASAIAQGLARAHAKGIVHRDIKPANIFITNDNQVKILDFGLAKLSSISRITRTGAITGTVAYMAPEMVRGEEIDHRADTWSLGVALFEMLTGQLPFHGENWEAIMYAIANKAPVSIQELRNDIPASLAGIITKMLQKNIADRYQDMTMVIADLQNIDVQGKPLTAETKPRASIAVLPFLDMSSDKDQEYLGDGLAEELINSLTAIKDLRVVARTSAFSFKGKNTDVRDIGRTLNVDHVLEGSVRKAGARLRITAQLVNVLDGYHLWSEKYERTINDMSDVFAIQDDISSAIVDMLEVKLLGKEKATLQKRYTENLEAYDLYLKGRYFWNRRTEKDLRKSIECFTQAIEIDPNYALAYAGLADSWIVLSDLSCLPSRECYPHAKIQASKALELDNDLAEAYTSLGMIKSAYDWDWTGAEKDFKKAIELKPGYVPARHWYAFHLTHLARFQESIVEYGKALEFDPLSLPVNLDYGRLFFYSHQHEQAIRQFQKVVEMDPGFPLGHAFLGFVYLAESRYEEALCETQRERVTMTLPHPGIECFLGVIYARMGERSKTEVILRKMVETSKSHYVSPVSIAWIHLALGNTDHAFEYLERAFEERDTLLRAIKVSRFFDNVHSDMRYIALLKKMGLDQ